jgi:hypothetical protein
LEGTPARVVIVAEIAVAASCHATLSWTLQRETVLGFHRDLDHVLEEAESCLN